MPSAGACRGDLTGVSAEPVTRSTRPFRLPSHRARRNSSWPWPSSPASPTISPARRSSRAGAAPGRSRSSRTPQHRSADGGRSGAGARPCRPARCSAPVISCTSRSGVASARSSVPTDSPERSTVTRSAISPTSSIRCEMNRIAMPLARRRRDRGEQPVPRGDVERRRRLVEDQHPRLAQQRAGDRARLPLRQRQRAGRRVQVDVAAEQLGEHRARPLAPLRFRQRWRGTRCPRRARRCRAPGGSRRRAPPGTPP